MDFGLEVLSYGCRAFINQAGGFVCFLPPLEKDCLVCEGHPCGFVQTVHSDILKMPLQQVVSRKTISKKAFALRHHVVKSTRGHSVFI